MNYSPFGNVFTAFAIIGFIISITFTAYGNWELELGFTLTLMFTLFVIASLLSAMPPKEEL